MIPNHVLILGSPHTGKLRVSELLLESTKVTDVNSNSHSGIIVKCDLKTKYYEAKLNILIDEYPSVRPEKEVLGQDDLRYSQLQEWYNEFKLAECKELRDVLDGFIFTINMDTDSIEYVSQCIETVNELRLVMEEESNEDLFFCIVGVSNNKVAYEEYEDVAIQNGLEFIYLNESGENEFKDKVGKDRLVEILETHEWKNISDVSHDETYKKNKLEKLNNEMMQSLLADDGEQVDKAALDQIDQDKNVAKKIDLTDLLLKLKLAKGEASNITDEQQREAYTNKVIEELIDYI